MNINLVRLQTVGSILAFKDKNYNIDVSTAWSIFLKLIKSDIIRNERVVGNMSQILFKMFSKYDRFDELLKRTSLNLDNYDSMKLGYVFLIKLQSGYLFVLTHENEYVCFDDSNMSVHLGYFNVMNVVRSHLESNDFLDVYFEKFNNFPTYKDYLEFIYTLTFDSSEEELQTLSNFISTMKGYINN